MENQPSDKRFELQGTRYVDLTEETCEWCTCNHHRKFHLATRARVCCGVHYNKMYDCNIECPCTGFTADTNEGYE